MCTILAVEIGRRTPLLVKRSYMRKEPVSDPVVAHRKNRRLIIHALFASTFNNLFCA